MIPEELRARKSWVAWQYKTRDGRTTKVPVSPVSGRLASSTDSSTWATYRQALAAFDAEGIGYVFSPDDPYVGVDMDGCVGANGAIHPAAYNVVRKLDGYVEFSPSGRGLHIIVRGKLERGRHTLKTEWRDEIAFYDRGRYFSMGDEGRGQIRDAQEALMELISYYFPEPEVAPVRPPKPVSEDDGVVLGRVLADGRIAALWKGDTAGHGGDASAADLALCAHLAFFTGNDVARIDGLFVRSGLMRDKWREPRGEGTYGSQTIEKAIRG